MDLADFPHLCDLYLEGTSVKGDIRDIGKDDFPSLQILWLPSGVYGGFGYGFHRISDEPNVIEAVSYAFQLIYSIGTLFSLTILRIGTKMYKISMR